MTKPRGWEREGWSEGEREKMRGLVIARPAYRQAGYRIAGLSEAAERRNVSRIIVRGNHQSCRAATHKKG